MIDCPNTNSTENIADWVEFSVVYENKPLSKSKMLTILQKNDNKIEEEDIDSVISEMIKRKSLYGDSSPFDIEGNVIKPKMKWGTCPELIMCLIFSLFGVKKKKAENDGTKLFERLSREAVQFYLEGKAIVIGAPNKIKLKEQIRNVSGMMCEEIGHICPEPNDKDKGVDIIAWKPHGDMRPNQIVLLLQCGAGSHFKEKKPISIRAWKDLIHLSADPVTGLVIPKIFSDSEEFMKLRNDYNLIFDRVRIYRAICDKRFSDRKLRKEISDWCKGRLT